MAQLFPEQLCFYSLLNLGSDHLAHHGNRCAVFFVNFRQNMSQMIFFFFSFDCCFCKKSRTGRQGCETGTENKGSSTLDL